MASNYERLQAKADLHFEAVSAQHARQMRCRAGCSGCCGRHLTLFAVEAEHLSRAIACLPGEQAERVAGQSRRALEEPRAFPGCPLLLDDRCAVYADRPIICRTHGVPVRVETDAGTAVDVCPLNFEEVERLEDLPAESVLNLETLNLLLAIINLRHCEQAGLDPGQRRSIGEVVLGALGHHSGGVQQTHVNAD